MYKQQSHHLAEIGFQRTVPSLCLRPFIQWFWAIQSHGSILEKRHEFMHSSGSLSILFNWGDELELSNGRCPQSVVVEAISPLSRQITLAGHVEAFGVLFRPGGAYPFFKTPMQEVATTDNLRNLHLPHLHEQLSNIPTLQGKVELVESWLIRLLSIKHDPSNIIPTSLKLINYSDKNQPTTRISNAINLSERQLERLFKKEVGLSPKKYANLVRLHDARLALKRGDTKTMTEIAHRAGFYDQAHFNREFKETIGMTPGAYASRQVKQ